MTATSVRLSEETQTKLDQLSARTGRSKSFYLRQAIEESIDRMVWEYSILDDLEQIKAGRAPTYSIDDVVGMYGLDD